MRAPIVTYLLLLSLSLYGYGHASTVVPVPEDSISTPPSKGKAISINVGLNMAMRGFNRFILKDEYAQINLSSMRDNLKTRSVWDTNRFSTNFIGHSYHGSMYFNSARANGLDLYQSSVVTTAGSLMWEYLMETKPPSRNDLWATTAGGTALGEALFRFSDLILDNRVTGLERVGRELLAGILAPTRLITRLTTGEVWKTGQFKGNILYASPYSLELYFGETTTGIADRNSNLWRSVMGTELQYGELFETIVEKPYEWFRLAGEAHIGNGCFRLSQINTIGLLFNRGLFHNHETWVTAGLFQHFNYYDLNQVINKDKVIPLYLSEAASIGPGIIIQKRKNRRRAQFEAHLSGIILGAGTSDHFKLEDRDYNFESGFSLKLYSSLEFKQKLTISLSSENYLLFSWKGIDDYEALEHLTINEIDFLNVQGDKSSSRVCLLGLNLKYRLNERTHVILKTRHLTRETTYKYFPSVNYSSNELFFGIGMSV